MPGQDLGIKHFVALHTYTVFRVMLRLVVRVEQALILQLQTAVEERAVNRFVQNQPLLVIFNVFEKVWVDCENSDTDVAFPFLRDVFAWQFLMRY